jgi:hypothetical protein
MRTILGCAALALAFSTATIPAQAKGCVKGALIGGTAGHFAGHHGLLGVRTCGEDQKAAVYLFADARKHQGRSASHGARSRCSAE